MTAILADSLARLILNLTDAIARFRFRDQVLVFEKETGRKPCIAFPGTFHEKLLWRKVFDHNPHFIDLSDKLLAKGHASRLCPEIGIPETLWDSDNPEDLPVKYLRGPYVIKTNHGWKQNYFSNIEDLGRNEVIKKFRGWLAAEHGQFHYEWSYFGVERRVFVERLVVDRRPC